MDLLSRTVVDLAQDSDDDAPPRSGNRFNVSLKKFQTVRVLSMPRQIFVVEDILLNNKIRLRFQSQFILLENSQINDFYVVVDASKVVLPEMMSLRTRQAIGESHARKTRLPAVVRKQKFYRLHISHFIDQYRWTQVNRGFWPSLNKDSRLLTAATGASRLLLWFLPNNGPDVKKEDVNAMHDVCAKTAPRRERHRWLDMLIGRISPSTTNNQQLEQIIGQLKQNIHCLQVLSVVSIEMRWRVEAHVGLWQRIYYEVIRRPIPIDVLNERNEQYSYKDLVVRRIPRTPRCRCGNRTFLIHCITQTYYCPTCFNEDLNLLLLEMVSLPLSAQSGKQGGVANMLIQRKSEYSGKTVKAALASDVTQHTRDRARNDDVIEPVQCLEVCHFPGRRVFSCKTNRKTFVLQTVLVHKTRGFALLYPTKEVAAARERYEIEKAAQLVEHTTAIHRYGLATKGITNGNRRQKLNSKKSAWKTIQRLGLLLQKGSSVRFHLMRLPMQGTIVEWLSNEAGAGEYYDVVVDTTRYKLGRDQLSVVSKPNNEGETHRKRRR